MNPELTAIAGALLLGSVLLLRRRAVFAFTCTGVYALATLVLTVAGVLLSPWWVNSVLPQAMPYVRWDLVRTQDLTRAIVITVGGLVLTLAGHALAELGEHAVGAAGPRRGRAERASVLTPDLEAAGFFPTRLKWLALAALILASMGLAARAGAVRAGLIDGYLQGSLQAQYDARFAMQGLGLWFYLIAYNVLPFLVVTAWMDAQLRGERAAVWQAGVLALAAATFLLLTFEKSGFMMLFVAFTFSHIVGNASRHRRECGTTGAMRLVRSRLAWGAIAGVVVLAGLFYLHLSQQLAAARSLGLSTSVAQLLSLAFANLLTRQSVQPILYAHVFPDLHPFYGLHNVGLLTRLTGMEFYSDTIDVLRFFSIYDFGSTSVGAVGDMYGAFGWQGWAIGATLLGVALYGVDRTLARLRASVCNRALAIMALTCAYYASQAAVVRVLSSYGALTFVLTWAALRLPLFARGVTRPADSPGPATATASA